MKTANELRSEIQALRNELAAWRTAMQLIAQASDEARRELGGPFGLTPPTDPEQAAAFLDRRTMLLHRVAQADALRVMWQSETGRPGANALKQGQIMQVEADLDRAIAQADPELGEKQQRIKDWQFRRAMGAE